jgi:hypothetical protein
MLSRVSLRGPHDETGAVDDITSGDFDAVIIEAEDPESEDRGCRLLCSDLRVFEELSLALPEVLRSEVRPDGLSEMKLGVSSEIVFDVLADKFGVEVIDLL